MTRQNLELARAANDAWNRGDIDAVLATRHPEFDWHTTGVFPRLDPVALVEAGESAAPASCALASQPTSRAGHRRLRAEPRPDWARRSRGSRDPPARPRS